MSSSVVTETVIKQEVVEEVGKETIPQTYGQVIPEQPLIKTITKKITNYVGFANLPKQYHRRSIQNGFQFNLMCCGKQGLGKSTLVNTLFNRTVSGKSNSTDEDTSVETHLSEKLQHIQFSTTTEEDTTTTTTTTTTKKEKHNVTIETETTNIQENGVSLKLTVLSTKNFGENIDNSGSWEPIVKEIESRYDVYLDLENQISRQNSTVEDPRVHCVLYFIEPTGHCLSDLDIECCLNISKRCNLLPVIAKSDTLSLTEVLSFKKRIMKQFTENNINLFYPMMMMNGENGDDNDESSMMIKTLIGKFPMAIMGSTDMIETSNETIRGRQYPWGFLEVDNPETNDFQYLKDILIKQHMIELISTTNKNYYENYRSGKLEKLGIKQDNTVFTQYDPNDKKLKELKLHENKLSKLELEMKQVFQQKVSEKEKILQKSEAELFARHKEMKDKLLKQLKSLEDKKYQLEMASSTTPGATAPGATTSASITTETPKKKGFLR